MLQEELSVQGGIETKDHLQTEELDVLIDAWMDEMHVPIDLPATKVHALVQRVLDAIPSNSVRSRIHEIRERIRDKFPQFSLTRKRQAMMKEESRRVLEKGLGESLDKGDLVIARLEGKAVGMVRFRKWDRIPPNIYEVTEFYEIERAVLLPEARGQGLYPKIREEAIRNFRKMHGDLPLISTTTNDAVKKVCRKDSEWQEISFREYLQLNGCRPEYIEWRMQEPDIEKRAAFIYLPASPST